MKKEKKDIFLEKIERDIEKERYLFPEDEPEERNFMSYLMILMAISILIGLLSSLF